MTNQTTATAYCPVSAFDAAAVAALDLAGDAAARGDWQTEARLEADVTRMREMMLLATPTSTMGAHVQLVGLDILLDDFLVDNDALDVDERRARILAAKSVVGRLLSFTSTATDRPA